MVGQRDLPKLVIPTSTCKHKVGRLAAQQTGSIASCISVWLCCLYPPDVLLRVSMFVPCRVFAVCPLALRLFRRQRSKGPSACRIQTAGGRVHRRLAAAEYSILDPGHHPFSFTICLRHGKLACGLTKIDQKLRFPFQQPHIRTA